jgi:hypothetical protein
MNEARLITFDTLQRRCEDRTKTVGERFYHCCRLLDRGGYPEQTRCNSRNCPVWRSLSSAYRSTAWSNTTATAHAQERSEHDKTD